MTRPMPLSPSGTPKILLILVLILGVGIVWQTISMGFWPAPFAVGLIYALVFTKRGWQYGGSLVIAILGNGLPLTIESQKWPMAKTADIVASIMGLGHAGIIIWVATLVWGALLGLAGAWLGHAIRALVTPIKRQSQHSFTPY